MRSVFFPTFCLQYLHLLLPPLPYHPIDAAVIACPVLCYPIISAMLSRPFDMLSHTVRCYLLLLFTSCPSTLLLTSATTYYAIRFLAMLLVIATSFLVLLPLVMFCYILFFLITRPHVFEHIFLATGPAFPSPTLIPLPWHLPSVLPFTPFTSFCVCFSTQLRAMQTTLSKKGDQSPCLLIMTDKIEESSAAAAKNGPRDLYLRIKGTSQTFPLASSSTTAIL